MDPITKFLHEISVPENYRPKSEVYIVECSNIYTAKTKDGFHTLPGGGLEKGETPKEAAHRECMEEIGVTIMNLKPIGKNPFCFSFDKSPEFMGDYDGMCTYSFVAKLDKQVNKGIEKHLKLDIITIDEMINFCRKGLAKYKVDWWRVMVKHRIEILNMIKTGK